MKKKLTVNDVAQALAESNPFAGIDWDSDDEVSPQVRAERLVKDGYIVEGDPWGWSSGDCAFTILMEEKGGNACSAPMSYYGDGMEVSFKASDRMPGYFIEFINAAVAGVYPD